VVEPLTVGIRKNQCLGFIGTEASGSGILLGIMAGFSYPTSGDITIGDRSLVKNYRKVGSRVN